MEEIKQETKKENMEMRKIRKPELAMLISFALVMLFLLAFGCYGCSYQSITPPDAEEAVDIFSKIANSTWTLDTAQGVPTLVELQDMVLNDIQFSSVNHQDNHIPGLLSFDGSMQLPITLHHNENEGMYLRSGDIEFDIKVVYSQSKDLKTETLALVGRQSNIHCYYLKK